jgi:MoaA/NifB/PqqE/SkfB family radical SAM enzyme
MEMGLGSGAVVVGEVLRERTTTTLPEPDTGPGKIYVEPTSRCNLICRFCSRTAWDEPLGEMDERTFAAVVEGLRALDRSVTVFFGGIGEPLAHPRLPEMVAQAKGEGARVELVTNGTLLDGKLGRALIAAGLDCLWVSLDAATPGRYGDLRLGAALPDVLENVRRFREARPAGRLRPEIGVAFVAMRRNVADLPAILDLTRRLGATRFHVSHLLAHTTEMVEETLYPQMPFSDPARFGGSCPFIQAGAVAVGWDGSFSPCLPLVHSSVSFLHGAERTTRRYVVGDVRERGLLELWEDSGHRAFRERVRAFRFAPCASCGSCFLASTNEDDCFGAPFPTCGGCLWAQGLIACP